MDAETVMGEYAAAWGRGDPEAAFAFYGDDIVTHLPGRGALAGTHRGRQAVIAAIERLLARTDGLPVEVEVVDPLVSEERVALVLREAATRGQEVLVLRRVNLYRVSDGKIRAIEIFEANQGSSTSERQANRSACTSCRSSAPAGPSPAP